MIRNNPSRPLNRRQLVIGATAGAAAFALLPARSLVAAQATPAAASYPELTVTITDNELKASATEVPSGYVLMTVVNQTKEANSAAFVGPGKDQTMDDLKKAMSAIAASGGNEFPPAIYQMMIPGGPGDLQPGASGSAYVHLTDGEWAIAPEGNQPPLVVTARTTDASSETEPRSVVTITEVDFAFGGFDAQIPTGKQVWKVVNTGSQPHMLGLFRGPATMTVAQILQIANLPENGTPPPGALQQNEITEVSGGVMMQSPGTTVYPVLDLPAGRYGAVCWVPDERTGQPHIMEGMLAAFDIGSAGTPVPTPGS